MAGETTIGTILPIAGDGAIDNPGVYFTYGRIVYAQAFHHPRSESLHNNVRRRRHLVEDTAPGRHLQIKRHALLVAVKTLICRFPSSPTGE